MNSHEACRHGRKVGNIMHLFFIYSETCFSLSFFVDYATWALLNLQEIGLPSHVAIFAKVHHCHLLPQRSFYLVLSELKL